MGQIPARLKKKIDANGVRPNMPCWKVVHFMHLKCVSAYSDYNNYKNTINYRVLSITVYSDKKANKTVVRNFIFYYVFNYE